MRTEEQGGKIKPANFNHDYTQWEFDELERCSEDPVYFIENYLKAKHPKKGVVPFKMWDFQKRMVKNYLEFEKVITLTSRQVGKTEVSTAFLLWWCCFKSDQNVLVLANKGRGALEIMKRFKRMYEDLPWWLKPGCTVNNVYSMSFDNGSFIEAQNTTGSTARGLAISLLYCDEFAFIPPGIQKEFWASVKPTLSNGGRCIITSTPNTDEDKFANIWFNAEDTPNSYQWTDRILEEMGIGVVEKEVYDTIFENEKAEDFYSLDNKIEKSDDDDDDDDMGFRRFFVHWREHPERDEKYKQRMLREGMTTEEWLREYEGAFVTGDPTLIESGKLTLLGYYTTNPRFVDRHGTYWYNDIEPNTSYAIVVDPAEGVGGDNAVIQVWSLPKLEQVAEWASNTADQIEQTRMLFRIMQRVYEAQQNDPEHTGQSEIYYSVEANGVGAGIINTILVEGEEKFPGTLIDSEGNKGRGLKTTMPSKKDNCLKLKKLIERNIFKPRSKALVSEFKTFIKRGKGYEAKQGAKDDRVMSCVLMCHMIEELTYHEDGLEEAMHVNLIEFDPDDEMDPDNIPVMPVI